MECLRADLGHREDAGSGWACLLGLHRILAPGRGRPEGDSECGGGGKGVGIKLGEEEPGAKGPQRTNLFPKLNAYGRCLINHQYMTFSIHENNEFIDR